MSYTSIPAEVRFQLWLQAGGRCQFAGCNKPLWKDTLTLRKMNSSYLAHIVADSPNGPRGDAQESEKLKDSLSNVMLLCGDHHRLIDGPNWRDDIVDALRTQKQEHEDRIERQTDLQPTMRTQIVLIGTRIGTRRGNGALNDDDAKAAVLPAHYPATDRAIQVDLSELELTEQDPGFWEVAKTHAERRLDPHRERRGRYQPPHHPPVCFWPGIHPHPDLLRQHHPRLRDGRRVPAPPRAHHLGLAALCQ